MSVENNKPRDIDELLDLLVNSGRSHKAYYHYTNWESFSKIYNGKSFLLTRGNSSLINDQHEATMKGSWEEWNRTYIGSFSFGDSENMAMWGLYGLPWEDAVRIAIPKKAMLRWVDKTQVAYIWKNNKRGSAIPFAPILSDIVYVNGISGSASMKLTHRDKPLKVSDKFNLAGLDTSPQMTGFIKNYAWHYENEVRLIARLPHSIGVEKILIDIPNDVLSEIKVTTGPSFQYQNSPIYDELCKENRIDSSGFENLVKYRPLCSMCQKGPFLTKAM